jgi:hypothetical protein
VVLAVVVAVMTLIMVRDLVENISIVTGDESVDGGGIRLRGERLIARGESRLEKNRIDDRRDSDRLSQCLIVADANHLDD